MARAPSVKAGSSNTRPSATGMSETAAKPPDSWTPAFTDATRSALMAWSNEDDPAQCWERGLGIEATVELRQHHAIRFLEGQFPDPPECLADEFWGRHPERQMLEASSGHRVREAARRGHCNGLTPSRASLRDRDERAEVPSSGCRREQHAHNATCCHNEGTQQQIEGPRCRPPGV
jgi:hypothetical protein